MLALGRFIPSKSTITFKNTAYAYNPNVLRNIRFNSKKSKMAYKDTDLAKISQNFLIANHDIIGKLNADEFNKFIGLTVGRKMDKLDLYEMFNKLDTNKDLYISKQEVEDHLKLGLQGPNEKEMEYAFCRFDKDFDDHLFIHELREALFYLGFFQAGDEKIRDFFCERDKDHDNRITYEEFAEIVNKDMKTLFY